MRDRSDDRVVHLQLARQAEARAQDQRVLDPATESATVTAYKSGLAFGRQIEWSAARRWWFTAGLCFGTAAGAGLAAACWALWRVPVVL